MRRILLRMVATASLLYLVVVALVVTFQRDIIYLPSPMGPATPASYGVPFREVRLPLKEGGMLAGWWLMHEPNIDRPTLLYCHGNGANLSLLAEVAANFYHYGWNALLFDYAGYGDSAPRPEGLHEEGLVQDGESAHRWLLSQGIPPQTIIIWGHSLGSAVAAQLAARVKPAGLILEGAFPSLYKMAKARYPWMPVFGFMLFDKFETSRYLEGRSYPVLVAHAERDSIIPLQFGSQVFQDASPPKQWVLFKGIDHNDLPSVHKHYEEVFKTFARAATSAAAR